MSHSVIVPPVHDTSPPPLDDAEDVEDDDMVTTVPHDETSLPIASDVVDNSNDEWKSVDDNNDTDTAQLQDDVAFEDSENGSTYVNPTNDEPAEEERTGDESWANFATFEPETEEILEAPPAVTTSIVVEEENNENDWADFESNATPSSEPQSAPPVDEPVSKTVEDDEDEDDFGEFSEVPVAPKPPTPSLPLNTLSGEQIESLISTCFPMESALPPTDHDSFVSTDLPSFTSHRNESKQIPYLQSSLSLWSALSNLSNDPVGIQFQWRKSHTERLFHQSLGVNERFRTKNVPLQPEILQPEKVKSVQNESENIENENKLPSETIRPHFDWKQSGLQNPLSDSDSSSLSSNVSKNEENVFDANKTLDLDFYVPTVKSPTEDESTTSISSNQISDSPTIPQPAPAKQSVPIKTADLFPGSTTLLSEDAKRIIDTLPNLSFMSAKALMFPIRFNSNHNDELY